MATSKRRINISLPEDIDAILVKLAKRDDIPQATKALHLIQLALEIEEDDIFDALAKKRDTSDAKFISHKETWA